MRQKKVRDSKLKIKPRSLIFGLLVVLIYFISGFFNNHISFFTHTNSVEGKRIFLNENTTAKSGNQLLWWEFKDGSLNLNFNNLIISQDNIQVYGKKTDESVGEINLNDSSKIGKYFAGSFVASLEKPIFIDINGDGIEDEVNIAAKADTLYTKDFNNKTSTYLSKSEFPLEMVRDGDYDLKMYYKGKILTDAKITVTAADGLNQKFVTDPETGNIHISNIKTLRNNINILYSEAGKYYLVSYIIEGHRLLSEEHFSALRNVGILFLISSIIIFIIIIIQRRNKNEKKFS